MSNMWPVEAKDKAHLVYKFVIFDCVHFGYTRDSSRRRSSHRRAGFWFVHFANLSWFSSFRGKVGCKSTMRISSIKGYVEIVTYEMRHNHPASQEASDEYHPQSWLLSGINVGDDDKVFRRRRRSKKQILEESAAAQAASHSTMFSTITHEEEGNDMISDQLGRMRALALSGPREKLDIFSNQLAEFEERWRQQLMATFQQQQQQSAEEPTQEAGPSQSEDPDPNASPPIIPVSTCVKLESL